MRERSPIQQEVCQTIRQPEHEHLNRLTVKPLDQVFIMRAKEGPGCSQFEAEALTNLVKEVCFPWLSQPEAIRAGQLAMTAVSADEPGHKPLTPLLLDIIIGSPCRSTTSAMSHPKSEAEIHP